MVDQQNVIRYHRAIAQSSTQELGVSDGSLRPLAVRGLADDVIERLRDAIALGELPQGQAINERDLARALGVSRGPVREALRKLHDECLVDIRHNHATIVRELSARDIEEVYSLRLVLERAAIERAAQHATEDDIAALTAALAVLTEAAETGTPRQVAIADVGFHDCIYRAARHERLEHAWKGLRAQVYVFLHLRNEVGSDYRAHAAAEHAELVELIGTGNVERASETIEQHLKAAYERLQT
jgi:DNA-binding GntR family transcriptional regulator